MAPAASPFPGRRGGLTLTTRDFMMRSSRSCDKANKRLLEMSLKVGTCVYQSESHFVFVVGKKGSHHNCHFFFAVPFNRRRIAFSSSSHAPSFLFLCARLLPRGAPLSRHTHTLTHTDATCSVNCVAGLGAMETLPSKSKATAAASQAQETGLQVRWCKAPAAARLRSPAPPPKLDGTGGLEDEGSPKVASALRSG